MTGGAHHMIRKKILHHIILLGGGNFRGVRDYPIDLGKYKSQLVYSPHDYGPLVYCICPTMV